VRALYDQGQVLTTLERYSAAENRLLDARTVNVQIEAPDSSLTTDLRRTLATLYAERDQHSRAKRWRERAEHPDSLFSAAPSPSN